MSEGQRGFLLPGWNTELREVRWKTRWATRKRKSGLAGQAEGGGGDGGGGGRWQLQAGRLIGQLVGWLTVKGSL